MKAMIITVCHSRYEGDGDVRFKYYNSYQEAINDRILDILSYIDEEEEDEAFINIANKIDKEKFITFGEYKYIFDNYFYDSINYENYCNRISDAYYEVKLIYVTDSACMYTTIDEDKLKTSYKYFLYNGAV